MTQYCEVAVVIVLKKAPSIQINALFGASLTSKVFPLLPVIVKLVVAFTQMPANGPTPAACADAELETLTLTTKNKCALGGRLGLITAILILFYICCYLSKG